VPTPSRRTVLTGVVAAGALSACTGNSPVAPPAPDPDELIAAEALAAETALLALLEAVGRTHPKRVRALARTRGVHTAHVQLLTEAVKGAQTPAPSPGQPFTGGDRVAFLAVARAEDKLGETLRRGAFRAESGPFARVLAGMAAATAQQAATLRRLA
jgi:hypothetical protein